MFKRTTATRIRVATIAMFAFSAIACLAEAQRPGGMNPQMQQQMVQRFDKNGNGQLDPDEMQAAQQAMQQMGGGRMGMGGGGMGGRPGGPGGPGGGGGPGGAGGMMMNPQVRQQLMQQFDKNGNGQIDPDEQQAMQQYMQQMGGGRVGMGGMGMGGRPGGPGGGGGAGGMMNPQMQQQMLQRFDKNGNGKLDPDEQQAAAQMMQQMRGGMGGQPGAGRPGGGQGKMQPAANTTTKNGKQTTNAAQDKQLQLLRFDKNGNGKLEPDELKASREAAKE